MPLHKEVPRSDIKTKFMKSSSFRKVFGLFFVVIFTQDKKIIRFHYILLNLSVETERHYRVSKVERQPLIEDHLK